MDSSPLSCPACNTTNPPQATFCFACAQPLKASAVAASGTLTGLLVQDHLLKQRYRILGQIGKGGFGAVYKAADSQFRDRLVAIKEMSQSSLNPQETSEATEAFKREALILAGLQHPNLPRIYDHFSDAGRWYLVMDFIEGQTLEEYLHYRGAPPRGGLGPLGNTNCLPVGEVLDIGIQLCGVLDYLHTRQPPIIFRDLKPANVMRIPNGHLYLIDFGIARHFKPGQIKDTMPLASPGYAAPEQYGKMQTTPRADVYSLGVTLHQLLSGYDPSQTPFRLPPLQVNGDNRLVSLDTLIKQMVGMDENSRPASMMIVKQELQRIMALPIRASNIFRLADLGLEHPESGAERSDGGAGSRGGQQQQMQQPPSRSRDPRPKRGISRRGLFVGGLAGLTGLVGVALGGGLLAQFLRRAEPVNVFAVATPLSKIPPTRPITSYTYPGHLGKVTSMTWSPDSQRVASASDDKTVQVWDPLEGTTFITYHGHNSAVKTVAWAPEGKFIASGGYDNTVQIWEPRTGDQILAYRGHSALVTTVAWSPDGTHIASGSADGTVHIWDTATGNTLFIYRGHSKGVLSVAWSSDGIRIASAGIDKTVQVWDGLAGHSIFTYWGHADTVNAVAWSHDGMRIASASSDGTVQVWDTKVGRLLLVYREHLSEVLSVAWSPDGRYLVSGGDIQRDEEYRRVRFWNASTGETFFAVSDDAIVATVVWAPDGLYIGYGDEANRANILQMPPKLQL